MQILNKTLDVHQTLHGRLGVGLDAASCTCNDKADLLCHTIKQFKHTHIVNNHVILMSM